MILTDNETKVDLLNNEAVAKTIIELIQGRPGYAITIGVHGDWGAGKSSVLEMIEAGLEASETTLCLKFNGWRFQGFEDAKIALIEGIVSGLLEKRPALRKAGAFVKDLFKRIDWLKVAKKAGGLALMAYTGIPSPELIDTAVKALKRLAGDPKAVATPENFEAAISGVEALLKPESSEHKSVPDEIAAFRKAFDKLLEDAGIQQLVVLIDDLDRCLPDTAIETLEAVRLFVFTSRTAFVVAADEAMIEYAVRKHFPDLPDSTGPRDYARNYLEKLIQVPFRIPALGVTETRMYVMLLLVGAELPEDDKQFGKLIELARERLKRPWQNEVLSATTVKTTLGEKDANVDTALTMSEQIGPLLARGTGGNPRQIKRFLNALLLRKRMANARGFGDDVRLQVLAKLMLAERFIPQLFDQIATSAAANEGGICKELAPLETAVARGEMAAKPDDSDGDAKHGAGAKAGDSKLPEAVPSETGILASWLSTQAVRDWAALEPSIAGVDLRPYLFVAKDRKDYFGLASALGPLAVVVEKLMGSKFQVSALEGDLRQLSPVEAIRVFDALKTRIETAGSLEIEPAGVAGIVVLVQAFPVLQTNLLEMLESLPPDRLGPWASSGWERVIKDAATSPRFRTLLQSWSESGSQMLKAAARNALRVPKGGH